MKEVVTDAIDFAVNPARQVALRLRAGRLEPSGLQLFVPPRDLAKAVVHIPEPQGAMPTIFGGMPVVGFWKIDRTTGKTEFCISGDAQCVEVTPQ
jgi:hypothetical protein